MKKIFILSVLGLIMLNQSCDQKTNEDLLEIRVNVLKKLNDHSLKDKALSYQIDIEMLNPNDTDLYFWMMTCSWYESWICSSDEIRLDYFDCPKNHPKLELIGAKEKSVFNCTLIVNDTLHIKSDRRFRLGFVLIKKDEMIREEEFKKLLHSKIEERRDIIWSNPFSL